LARLGHYHLAPTGVRGYLTGSRKVLNSIPRVSVRLGGSGVNRTQNHPVAPALAENDDRWSLVLRVAASRQFTKAPQLHDMLLYICQRALTDPAASIKEHEIGCNALAGRRISTPTKTTSSAFRSATSARNWKSISPRTARTNLCGSRFRKGRTCPASSRM
jgi:hypothetical protein